MTESLGTRQIRKGVPFGTPFLCGVTDGARTHDIWNHNPTLCQLSYSHHLRFATLRRKPVVENYYKPLT